MFLKTTKITFNPRVLEFKTRFRVILVHCLLFFRCSSLLFESVTRLSPRHGLVLRYNDPLGHVPTQLEDFLLFCRVVIIVNDLHLIL